MFPEIILTEKDLHDVVDHFMQYDSFAFDTEGRGPYSLLPVKTEVTWLSLATHGAGVAIPFGHVSGRTLLEKATSKKNPLTGKFDQIPPKFTSPPQQLRPSQVFDILRPLFFSDRVKIGFNVPFDVVSVTKYFGDIPRPPYRDVGVAQWALDENFKPMVYSPKLGRHYPSPRVGLKEMVEHYFGVRYDQEEIAKNIDLHTFGTVGTYSYLDAVYTWLLDRLLIPKLDGEGVAGAYFDLEMPVTKALMRMAVTGVPVDTTALMTLKKELDEILIQQEADVYRAAGRKFNIGSPQQKQKILYDTKKNGGQGLKPTRLTDVGRKKKRRKQPLSISDYSTDAKALSAYPENEVVKTLKAHGETDKLLNSFLNSWLGDPEAKDKPPLVFDGWAHPQFKQHGAKTGRFSCSKFNAQQIPRPGKPLSTKVRSLFRAPPGHRLIIADYSQIELRVLAHYIGAGGLYEGFLDGVDAHTATAALIFGVRWEDVTAEQRQVAKGCNFCIVYGGGASTLAEQAGITVKQAEKVLAAHERAFPEIHAFSKKVVRRCRDRQPPHIITLAGRKRRIPEIDPRCALKEARRGLRGQHYNERELRSFAWSIQSKAERQAVNSLIQGSAADLAKYALINLDEAFEADFESHRREEKRINLSLTVHDEFVCIAPEERADIAAHMVKEAMVGKKIQNRLSVPLHTDVKSVESWDAAK